MFFLIIYIRKSQKETVESYEVESFINTVLSYTTECADRYEPNYLTIKKLITSCDKKAVCTDNRPSCEVLEETLKGIIEESWRVNENTAIKGYELNITLSDENVIPNIKRGNVSNSYKEAGNSNLGNNIGIFLRVYY